MAGRCRLCFPAGLLQRTGGCGGRRHGRPARPVVQLGRRRAGGSAGGRLPLRCAAAQRAVRAQKVELPHPVGLPAGSAWRPAVACALPCHPVTALCFHSLAVSSAQLSKCWGGSDRMHTNRAFTREGRCPSGARVPAAQAGHGPETIRAPFEAHRHTPLTGRCGFRAPGSSAAAPRTAP